MNAFRTSTHITLKVNQHIFMYLKFENILRLSFVDTPRKFIIAELSIRKLGSSSVLIIRLFEFTRPFFIHKVS